jgi:putative nucleotidyltransferase with HDIG domain
MHGESKSGGTSIRGTGDAGASTRGYRATAEDLAREFGAPAGLFDPESRCWRALVGAPEGRFPGGDDSLVLACRSNESRAGRASVRRRAEDPDVIWLVLPLPRTPSTELVAWLGFRAAEAPPQPPRDGSEGIDREPISWGPSCPEPALRLWGQQAVNRMQSGVGIGAVAPAGDSRRDEESEHVVIGRLIRRLRISDSPDRFQALATTVLRSSLTMAAVAWVPKEPREPVVVAGSVDGLDSPGYRALPAPGGRETALVVNDGTTALSRRIPAAVRRYASVASGSLGFLVAVNPLDDRPIGAAEVERLQYVASLIETQLANAKIYADLKELLFGIIRALTAAIDAKDPYTSGHSERVARMAVRIAEELGMPSPKRSDLYVAGLLHDVGKIGIDDDVLKKGGPLTPQEFRKIQSHVEIGVTILKDLKKLSHILPGVRHHHESYDGTGYPDGLAGEEIPYEARILAIADSFDAMSSNRPYRKRLSLMQIDEIFRKGRGQQWDPAIVDALFACRFDLEAIRQKGLGESLIGAVDVALGRGA